VILTADHGHTPDPETTGAWPINPSGLKADMDATFEVPDGKSLFFSSTAVGPFLKRGLMADLGVSAREVAKFYEDYPCGTTGRRASLCPKTSKAGAGSSSTPPPGPPETSPPSSSAPSPRDPPAAPRAPSGLSSHPLPTLSDIHNARKVCHHGLG
jgi:hypothetical protein